MKYRRISALFCILLIASGTSGCGGGTLFIDTGPNGTTVVAVSGTCIGVHITTILGSDGKWITITVVTLITDGRTNNFNFCGDVADHFPLNSSLTVNFTTGTTCATPTSIVLTT